MPTASAGGFTQVLTGDVAPPRSSGGLDDGAEGVDTGMRDMGENGDATAANSGLERLMWTW